MSDWPSPTGTQHRAGRRAVGLVAFAAAVAFPARGDPADDPSAVVVIGGLEPDGALAAADRRGARATGASRRWRRARCPPEQPQAELDTLARSYREADFLRCLTRVEHALDPDDLLQRGRRAEAAQAGTLAAACALGAGDEARARDLLRRLSVRELVEPGLAARHDARLPAPRRRGAAGGAAAGLGRRRRAQRAGRRVDPRQRRRALPRRALPRSPAAGRARAGGEEAGPPPAHAHARAGGRPCRHDQAGSRVGGRDARPARGRARRRRRSVRPSRSRARPRRRSASICWCSSGRATGKSTPPPTRRAPRR